MSKEVIEFNGIQFVRYPDSPSVTARRYFLPYRDGRRAKGIGTYHRELWKSVHGEIPPGHDIYHKDGDFLNNSLDNLECLTKKEHSARHAAEHREARRAHVERIRPLASAWHGSPEGLEFHRRVGKSSWDDAEYVGRTCTHCGSTYSTRGHGGRSRFCSKACIQASKRAEGRYKEERRCVICGQSFLTIKYGIASSCSPKCRAALRRRDAMRKLLARPGITSDALRN